MSFLMFCCTRSCTTHQMEHRYGHEEGGALITRNYKERGADGIRWANIGTSAHFLRKCRSLVSRGETSRSLKVVTLSQPFSIFFLWRACEGNARERCECDWADGVWLSTVPKWLINSPHAWHDLTSLSWDAIPHRDRGIGFFFFGMQRARFFGSCRGINCLFCVVSFVQQGVTTA